MENTNKQRTKERWRRFGLLLKQRREALLASSDLWTQGYVAEQVGLTRQTYNNIENGKPTKPSTIMAIAHVLRLDAQVAMFNAGFAPDPKSQQDLSPQEISLLADFQSLPDHYKNFLAAQLKAAATYVRSTEWSHQPDPDSTYRHDDPPLQTTRSVDESQSYLFEGVRAT